MEESVRSSLEQLHLTEQELCQACLNAVADGHRVAEVLEELIAFAGHPVGQGVELGRHRQQLAG